MLGAAIDSGNFFANNNGGTVDITAGSTLWYWIIQDTPTSYLGKALIPGAPLTLDSARYPLMVLLDQEWVSIGAPAVTTSSYQAVAVTRAQRGTTASTHQADPAGVKGGPTVTFDPPAPRI